MNNSWYISVGIVGILLVVVSLFVFKVSGSEGTINVEKCTPYNVEIREGEEGNTVNIFWRSKERCSGYILYGKEMRGLDMVGVDLENEVESKEHLVVLKGLITSKKYYFTIISNGMSFGKEGLPLQFSIESL